MEQITKVFMDADISTDFCRLQWQ